MTQGFENIYDPVKYVIENPSTAPLPTLMVEAVGFTRTLAGAMTLLNAEAIHTYLVRLGPEYVLFGWQQAVQRDMDLHAASIHRCMSSHYLTIERTGHG